MPYFFLVVALLVALLDWVAVVKGWQRLGYVTKPGVMVALLAWLWQVGGLGGPMAWFALGLLFSLAGDVFLMLPREQFIAGLVSFLLAHLAYLVGFLTSPPPLNLAGLALVVLLGMAAAQVYRRISAALAEKGKTKLRLPLLAYTTVISLMVLSALMTLVRGNDEWLVGPALLVSAGALLFYLSDALLAWNKFVVALPYGRLRVRITYHLGQALIVFGAVNNFIRPT